MNKFTVEYMASKVLESLKDTVIYRDAVAAKKTHILELTEDELVSQIVYAIKAESSSTRVTDARINKTISYVKTFISEVNTALLNTNSKIYRSEDLGCSSNRTLVEVSSTANRDVYRYILDRTRKAKLKLFKSIQDTFKSNISMRKFFDLSHEKNSQIGINAADLIIDEITQFFAARPGISRKETDELVNELYANFKNPQKMYVTFKSVIKNRGSEAQSDKAAYQSAVKSIKQKLIHYSEDIATQKVEKETLLAIRDAFRKNKKWKLSGFKIYDLKEEFKSLEKKKVEGSISKSKFRATKGIITRKTKVSLNTIMAYMNTQLPGQVAENMGTLKKPIPNTGPLNYQTGRFAQSALITNISLSTRGATTISYTYMRDPYSTFEKNATRDPRKLISKSIREIAVGLIDQDFRTRRV